jgi:putative DNA primase/helicase
MTREANIVREQIAKAKVIPIDADKLPKSNGAHSETPPPWTASLRVRGGRFIGDEANVLIALREAPELRDLVRFNEFKSIVEFARSPSWRCAQAGDTWMDQDDLDVQEWLQHANVDVRFRGTISDCIERVSRQAMFHPVRDYLSSLKWDGQPRLASVLQDYFSATGSAEYLTAIGTKFFISAIARICKPGCQVDHVLVIEGAQGTGKTSSTRILGGRWVTDGLPNLHDKDAAIYLQGVWICELPELTAIRRTTDLESTKAFLSRTTDRIRPPYGRRTIELPRQCVFIATTNEAQYLRDATGNRRFWPVSCGQIDLVSLERDRSQLWAEAHARFQRGDLWHLSVDESKLAQHQQDARVYVSEMDQTVGGYLDGLVEAGTTEITVRDVLIYGLSFDPASDRFTELAGKTGPQVAHFMTRQGWQRLDPVGRGKNRRVVYRFYPKTHRES